jgi:hypothetical protein
MTDVITTADKLEALEQLPRTEAMASNTAQAMFAELMTLILSRPDFIGVVFVRSEEPE